MSLNRTMSNTYIQSDLKRQKLTDSKSNDESFHPDADLSLTSPANVVKEDDSKMEESTAQQTPRKVVKKVNKKKAPSELSVIDEINTVSGAFRCHDHYDN